MTVEELKAWADEKRRLFEKAAYMRQEPGHQIWNRPRQERKECRAELNLKEQCVFETMWCPYIEPGVVSIKKHGRRTCVESAKLARNGLVWVLPLR